MKLRTQTRFPTMQQREECGEQVGLTNRQVQVWFQVRILAFSAVTANESMAR